MGGRTEQRSSAEAGRAHASGRLEQQGDLLFLHEEHRVAIKPLPVLTSSVAATDDRALRSIICLVFQVTCTYKLSHYKGFLICYFVVLGIECRALW